MATTPFARLPGFRDFPPEEAALRSHIFDAWRRVSQRYGFSEYDGPPLEPLELYLEKSGEEIVGQLYAFTDKGERQVALRPEMTPSLARILAERSRALAKPIRWFSIPQLFRYERQQRGRLREHFQWNVDIVGEEGVAADSEILAVAIDALRLLGLGSEHFGARVSDRRLLTSLLVAAGVGPERVPAAFAIIDKLGREPRERSVARLTEEAGLSTAGAAEVLEVVESSTTRTLADRYGDRDEVGPHLERLDDYLARLAAMGLGDFVRLDLAIVRGLAYYTGIVFELFDIRGDLRAICGGGRYDDLLERVGGESLPAVGFGMGDVVLGELLGDHGMLPDLARSVDYFVVVVSEAERAAALGIAHALREKGHSVAYALREQSVGKQMKTATREGARRVIVVGPEELRRESAVVRDLASGEEREVRVNELG